MSQKISVETEQKLIDCVRDRPCIWDKGNKNYKNTQCKERAWNTIGTVLDLEGTQAKETWASLRGQFSKFQRRLAHKFAENRRPYFRHEDEMKFLLNNVETSEDTFLEFETTEELDVDNDSLWNQTQDMKPCATEEKISVSNSSISSRATRLERLKRRSNKTNDEEVPKPKKYEEKPSKQASYDDDSEDEYEAFGKILTKKFRKLGEANRKSFLELQFKVNTIVHEAEMENL